MRTEYSIQHLRPRSNDVSYNQNNDDVVLNAILNDIRIIVSTFSERELEFIQNSQDYEVNLESLIDLNNLKNVKIALSRPEFKCLNHFIQKKDAKENCSICLEDLQAGQSVTLLNCSHKFHRTCAQHWLSNAVTCPMCRADTREMLNKKVEIIDVDKPIDKCTVKELKQLAKEMGKKGYSRMKKNELLILLGFIVSDDETNIATTTGKKYSVIKLKKMCKNKKIKGYSRLRKNELIEILNL